MQKHLCKSPVQFFFPVIAGARKEGILAYPSSPSSLDEILKFPLIATSGAEKLTKLPVWKAS